MATYRYNSFKFPAAALAGVDADAVKGLRSYLAARESVLNTITTNSRFYDSGPFAGQTIELESAGTLSLSVKGWIGHYEGGKWHGTTGETLAIPEPVGELAKSAQLKITKGYEACADLFGKLAEPIEDHTEQTTITKTGYACIGKVDDFGNARDISAGARLVTDDFGNTEAQAQRTEIYSYKHQVTRAVYRIGRTTYKVQPTAQAVDNLRAKLIKAKKWLSDKAIQQPRPAQTPAEQQTDRDLSAWIDTQHKTNASAAQDVASVLASAQAAAAIEHAQESAQVAELGDVHTTTQAEPVQAVQAQAACELETVGEYGGSAGQNSPGAPDEPRGYASTSNTPSAAHGAAWLASKGLQGQTINSKSGAWRATFFLDHDGKPCMMFNDADPQAFTSGSARMKGLQQLARDADLAAAQAAKASAAATPADGVCPALLLATTPNQPAPVLESETPQDASPAPESETPQDAAPVFQRFKPINLDPRDLLARGVAAAQLVGLGVTYTGDMANPSGCGAITAASDSRAEPMGRLDITVSLEDGRVIRAEPHYFTAALRPILQFNGMMHGAPYLAQLAAAVATVKAQASSAKEQAAQAHSKALQDLSAEYAHLQRAESKHSGGKLAAINMRTLLKQAFPGQKFSVTSDYNSARVTWTDGPTDAQVTAIISRFDIGASDCQSDYFYTVSTAFSDLFGGVQYLFTNRHTSEEFVTKSLAAWWPTRGESATAATPTAQDWIKATGAFCWATGCEYLRACFRKHLASLSAYQAPAAKARKASRA